MIFLKQNLLLILIIFGLFFIVGYVSAHPGGTDSYGCHTCKTNCYDWGLSYGEYHCHQSKGLTQPYDPITCTYGIGCEYEPDYESPYSPYSYPSTPDCPLNSYYDSLSDNCKCYSGYVADGNSCVSGDSYCWDNYGYNSQYDSLSKSCECRYGYVLSGNTCISRDSYCQDLLGFNAEYKYGDTCGCRSGYVLNSSQTSCISGDTYCQNLYGYHSNYISYSKTCECDYGYGFRGGECIEEVEENNYYFPTILIPTYTPKPTILYTPLQTPKATLTPRPTPIQTPFILQTSTPIVAPVLIPSPISNNQRNETDKSTDINFKLVGNELLRECPKSDCKVIKYGSINGSAEVINKENDWYKVIVSERGIETEGWFHSSLIPDDIEENYLANVAKQQDKTAQQNEVQKPNPVIRFFGLIFNLLF